MLELEHGFTDRFQASFYLKGRFHRYPAAPSKTIRTATILVGSSLMA